MKRTLSLSMTLALFVLMALFVSARLTGTIAHAQQGLDNRPDEPGERDIIKHGINPGSDNASENSAAGSHDAAPTTGGTTATSAISYHGGPLISTPTAYVIWYGSWNRGNGTDTPAGQQIVRDFLNSIGGSSYYLINTSYSVSGQTISGNASFGGETTDAYSQGTRLTDNGVLAVVNSAITSGRLPFNSSGVYFVLSSSDVAESSGFCTQYCGWHTASSQTYGRVRFSFVGNAARCLSSCAAQSTSPNGNPGVDGMLSVVAHELEEAVTDPDPRSGWADGGGAENADKCAWTFGHAQYQVANGSWANMHLGTRDYLIQRNLHHSTSGDFCWINNSGQN